MSWCYHNTLRVGSWTVAMKMSKCRFSLLGLRQISQELLSQPTFNKNCHIVLQLQSFSFLFKLLKCGKNIKKQPKICGSTVYQTMIKFNIRGFLCWNSQVTWVEGSGKCHLGSVASSCLEGVSNKLLQWDPAPQFENVLWERETGGGWTMQMTAAPFVSADTSSSQNQWDPITRRI